MTVVQALSRTRVKMELFGIKSTSSEYISAINVNRHYIITPKWLHATNWLFTFIYVIHTLPAADFSSSISFSPAFLSRFLTAVLSSPGSLELFFFDKWSLISVLRAVCLRDLGQITVYRRKHIKQVYLWTKYNNLHKAVIHSV